MKFTIVEVDDETIEFLVNDKLVAMTDHDELGWAGMSKMKSMFLNIAIEVGSDLEYR